VTVAHPAAGAQQEPREALSDRDLAVLKTVSDLRFVKGKQLARIHFAQADGAAARTRTARRALVRLVRHDYLARLSRRVGGVRSGSAGFIYCLGLAGQRLAILHGWQPERRRRRSQVPGTRFLGHTLAVAELHTLLIEADRSRRFELLELAAEPACWRSFGGIGGQRPATLKPDSYVRLGMGEFEDSYFIEIDMGTEGSQTLLAKLKQYVAYRAAGSEQDQRGVFPKVLWLVPDERRVGAVEGCVAGLSRASRELFAVARQEDVLDVVSGTSLTEEQPDAGLTSVHL
jgi:hypothetical protein